MKKLLHFTSMVLLITLLSCREKKADTVASGTNSQEESATDSIAKPSYFPVTNYLKGQMMLLDSMHVTFLQVTNNNNRMDSSWLNSTQLKALLAPFIADEINQENMVPFFKETKFKDETTNAITFTYEPIQHELPDTIYLRNWTVYVTPETGTIKRVYIVKQFKKNEATITRQLTWVAAKSASIRDIVNNTDGTSKITNETKWVWNFNDEETE